MTEPVLTVEGLSVRTPAYPLLDDVSFTIGPMERLGLIGESGSGKSLTALSVIGLLPETLTARGTIRLGDDATNLVEASERDLAKRRGRDVAMVFQEPMSALNPTMRVRDQIAEVMLVHGTVSGRKAARAQAVVLLDQVGLDDPERAATSYPHQLSGGQRQRVVIAIAMANDPALLICDEPTTALDVTVQAQVLDLIVSEADSHDAALLFITHDLAVVALVCQRVVVMYGGRVVEAGPVAQVFTDPRHPYTQGLLAASELGDRDVPLPTIAGSVPGAGRFPEGCVFRNRCPRATDECAVVPAWTDRAGSPSDDRDLGFACYHPVGVPA